MESWEINGVTLEYDNETHSYIADGLIIPSVTTVLEKTILKDMYRDVDAAVLRRETTRGAAIYKDIKDYCKGTERKTDEVRGFKILQRNYDIVPLCNEVPILIFNNNKPIMAGRFDLLADIKGKTTLCDIKSTAQLNVNYLGYQLNLYRVGLRQSYRQEVAGLAGIHLRGLTRKLVNISIDDFKVKEIIERYEQSNTNGAAN